MEKKYRVNSLSLGYSLIEDRIQWLSHISENEYVTAWVTRRFLMRMVPKISHWLVQSSTVPGKKAQPVKAQSAARNIVQFQHEMAQKEVPVTKEKKSDKVQVDEFVVASINLTPKDKDIVLYLMSNRNDEGKFEKTIGMRMSPPHLHRILGELMSIAKKAEWSLDNPLTEASISQQSVVH